MTPHPRLVAFDLDGTLIEGHVRRMGADGESGEFEEVLPFHVVNVLPGRREKLSALLDADVKVAICTNKAGVAWGHLSVDDCRDKRAACEFEFGVGPLDWKAGRWSWYEAYGHPGAPDFGSPNPYAFDDPMRKPRPGMLLAAMCDLGEEPSTTLYVGDMETDREAAWRAGVPFTRADDYFKE